MKCSFDTCDRKAKSKGLCPGHYWQKSKGKELTPLRRHAKAGATSPCSFEGCSHKSVAKGLCHSHWRQQHKGNPLTPLKAHLTPNEMVIHDDFAEIILEDKNRNETGRTKVDLSDLPLLSKYRWAIKKGKRGTYVSGRRLGSDDKVLLHRVLLDATEDLVVDHWNGDGLDNRRENIKLVSHKENQENQKVYSTNTSGYRGVSWRESEGKWYAYYKDKNMMHSIGFFDDLEEAAEAARTARENAYTNFQTRSSS